MIEENVPLLGGPLKITRWLPLYWLCAVTFCLSVAGAMLNVPLTRLIEANLCSRYAADGIPTEESCKSDRIQSKLAYLNGCLPMVEAIVGMSTKLLSLFKINHSLNTGLIVAFPFGALADR